MVELELEIVEIGAKMLEMREVDLVADDGIIES